MQIDVGSPSSSSPSFKEVCVSETVSAEVKHFKSRCSSHHMFCFLYPLGHADAYVPISKVHEVINNHHGAEFRGKWEFHKIGTLLLVPIVSTCYVPSREVVPGRNEVEFLRGFHSVPAQVTASRGRDWGGPVFDSPMLNPRLIGDRHEVASQSALDWGLRLMWRVSPRLIGDCREVASQSALDWGLRFMWRVSPRLIGDCREMANQSALDWGLSRSGQLVRA
ncbi:hypothetical protein ACLB2K_026362 [Fragaria x ananassa]